MRRPGEATTGGLPTQLPVEPLPAQLAISGSALVVPDETEQFTRDDLVGLGAAVEEFRSRHGVP